jgi:hypothetical protein
MEGAMTNLKTVSAEWIQHLLKLSDHFPLRTQATG